MSHAPRSRTCRVLGCAAAALWAAGAWAAAEPPLRTLSLEDALRGVEADNLELAQVRARADQALSLVRQAASAVLPTLVATGSYTRNSDEARAPIGQLAAALLPPGAPVPADILIQPRDLWAAGGTLRLPLVHAAAWAEVLQARHGADAAAEAVVAARATLRATFLQAAWWAGAGEEVVAAAERGLDAAREQARSAERAERAGTGTALSVLQARAEAVRRESELALARADLGRSRLALGVLLGGAQPVRVLMPEPRAEVVDPAAVAADALERRAEVRAARERLAAAEQQLEAAWLRLVPQLAAVGSAFVQDQPAPTGKQEGWRVGLELTWALYDGGYRYGRRDQALGAIAEARAALQAQRNAVVQEVEDAARDVAVAIERARLAAEQREVAAEAAATARRGFAGGLASSLDVLDANDRLFQAEVGAALARARLGSALAALDRAAARG